MNNQVVGIAIGTMLSTATLLRQASETLQQHGIVPEQFYYFGEMILVPEYRNKGIGKQMLEALKNAGREQGLSRFCFLSVARSRDDVRRPADYVDSDVAFYRFGFEKTEAFVMAEWRTIQEDGRIEKVSNRLDFWVDRTPGNLAPASNLYTDMPQLLPEELIEVLVDSKDVRIERIVSTGHTSPPGFWYDQPESEWVVVLHGEAILEFEDEKRHMVPGDFVLIPPHRKHRVSSTSMKEPTVWLAVFFGK
jgi:cupin 2 domain-containing protein